MSSKSKHTYFLDFRGCHHHDMLCFFGDFVNLSIKKCPVLKDKAFFKEVFIRYFLLLQYL